MHIVYVSREYPPSRRGGGIATYVKIMAEGFAKRGNQVTVIAASDNTNQYSVEMCNGVEIHRIEGADFLIGEAEPGKTSFAKFRCLYRFKSYRHRIIEEIANLKNVDIIEVPEFGAEGLYLNELRIPVVYRLHTPALLDHISFKIRKISLSNLPYYFNGLKELSILKKQARHITSCSTSLKHWSSDQLHIPEERISVIYNPIPDDFSIDLHATDKRSDKKMVFFAGTVCDWKGAGDLVEACRILNRNGNEINLIMAGKAGRYADSLRETNKSEPWLKIIGKVSQDDLKALYQTAGVVCFPSWWENMPMVCIEAMACGAIVIGSNSGGMSEIIENEKNGFLLPPQHPELWARKINEVLGMSDNERNDISKAAQMRIKDVFSLDKILNETYSYYQKVIDNESFHMH